MKYTRNLTRTACIALICMPFQAPADAHGAFRPLEEIVRGGAEHSTVALHCAGLFHSVWDFLGDGALGAETSATTKQNAALFLEAGKSLRASETGRTSDDTVAEAFAVSTLYFKRYEANVAAGRDAFADDPVWQSDLEICRRLADQL